MSPSIHRWLFAFKGNEMNDTIGKIFGWKSNSTTDEKDKKKEGDTPKQQPKSRPKGAFTPEEMRRMNGGKDFPMERCIPSVDGIHGNNPVAFIGGVFSRKKRGYIILPLACAFMLGSVYYAVDFCSQRNRPCVSCARQKEIADEIYFNKPPKTPPFAVSYFSNSN